MKKVFTILYLLFSIKTFAQKNVLCDTVYDHPETVAYFKNENIGLMKFINTRLAPILIECQTESQLIASMSIVLTTTNMEK